MTAIYDKRAWRILHDAYWSSAGWREPRGVPNHDDLAYAIEQKVMFHPVELQHDLTLNQVQYFCDSLAPAQVGDAFLASLSSRELGLRSCLGSYANARARPAHVPEPASTGKHCKTCGLPLNPPHNLAIDLNVLNFERLKWGGVRHFSPEYQWLDLSELSRLPRVQPTIDDLALFRELLITIAALPSDATGAMLAKQLPKTLPSNAAERAQLVQILGYAGVIAWPGFRDCYSPSSPPPGRTYRDTDWQGPAANWRAADGFRVEPLREFFATHVGAILP